MKQKKTGIKKMLKRVLLLSMTLLLWTTGSYAGFSGATHDTDLWQRLDAPGDTTYGVSWSIDGGAYGHVENIAVADGDIGTIKFRFDITKPSAGGNHDWDIVKAWAHMHDPGNRHVAAFGSTQDFLYQEDKVTRTSLADAWYVYSPEYYLTNGTTYLRARVTCDTSLSGTGTRRENMRSSGKLVQGETEDWTLTVSGAKGRGGDVVPEPAAMVLFGFGLIGLAGIGRRKS